MWYLQKMHFTNYYRQQRNLYPSYRFPGVDLKRVNLTRDIYNNRQRQLNIKQVPGLDQAQNAVQTWDSGIITAQNKNKQ